jgi:polyhydroxybutyrate depolymerase
MLRLVPGVLAATVIALVLGGCDRDDGAPAPVAERTTAGSPIGGPEATPVSEVTGCGAPGQPAPGDHDRVLRLDGRERTYLLHVPPAYDGAERVPLVLNFHGFGSSGRQQANYSRFPAKADAEGFIVVSPDASTTGADTQRQWNLARSDDLPDDIAFVRHLLDELSGELCIDRDRVFAAGMSNGAAFAQQIACAMPERIAAVAAVTALVYPATCTADLPIAVIGFHGTEDACVPYGGGVVTCGRARGSVAPVEEAARDWARHNGCNLAASAARLSPEVRTLAFSECDEETAVVLFTIDGGGHTWPGSIEVPRLGAVTDEIDATEQIWQFFAGQANLRAGSPSP